MLPPQIISELLNYALSISLGAVAIAAVLLMAYHHWAPYLGEKGKNLATKEDIAEITEKIEAVKDQYVQLLEDRRQRQQLRMAAIDKRLQAHQEAFQLWRRLVAAVHTDKIHDLVLECQDWWEQHCLYLEPDVRDGFVNAYFAAKHHPHVTSLGDRNAAHREAVEKNYAKLENFGTTVLNAMKLPAFSNNALAESDVRTHQEK